MQFPQYRKYPWRHFKQRVLLQYAQLSIVTAVQSVEELEIQFVGDSRIVSFQDTLAGFVFLMQTNKEKKEGKEKLIEQLSVIIKSNYDRQKINHFSLRKINFIVLHPVPMTMYPFGQQTHSLLLKGMQYLFVSAQKTGAGMINISEATHWKVSSFLRLHQPSATPVIEEKATHRESVLFLIG